MRIKVFFTCYYACFNIHKNPAHRTEFSIVVAINTAVPFDKLHHSHQSMIMPLSIV